MEKSIFEFSDYKVFLLQWIDSAPRGGRGVRRRLAEACACQVAYVSHVLAADRHFSLEQAEAAARFMRLREDELEFFILLVERARAGTVELRRYFDRQLNSRRRAHNEIQKRVRIEQTITSEDQATYYSSWHYQAIHSALTIEGINSVEHLAARLNFSVDRINSILLFLLQKGLIHQTSKGYSATAKYIHLPRQSPLIGKLHANWRIKTLSVLERQRQDDMHYSGLVTLAEKDVATVREILKRALANAIDVVKPSKEETLCVLAMDFYEL